MYELYNYDLVKGFIENESSSGDTLLSEHYESYNQLLSIKCKQNNTYSATFHEYFIGLRCPKCMNNTHGVSRYTDKEKKSLIESKGYKVSKVKVLGGKMELLCPEGHSTYIKFTDFIRSGRRCSTCGKSCGEIAIRDFLKRNNIAYEWHYEIPECKSISTLKYDFAVFNKEGELAFLFEYDGIEHFRAKSLYGDNEGLTSIQMRDEIKNNFCIREGIPLVRIPYWQINDIDEILTKQLKYLLQ